MFSKQVRVPGMLSEFPVRKECGVCLKYMVMCLSFLKPTTLASPGRGSANREHGREEYWENML